MESQSRIEGLQAGESSAHRAVSEALRRINRAWLDGRPNDLIPLLHPAMSMVYPGFAGRGVGRDAIIAGFVDFCANARVHSYREGDAQVDVMGDTAVASNTFEMVYERSGETYQATGRDLWVFTRHEGEWVGAWRTMLDLVEKPA
jgi:uncharacterized protein DUF4440